MTSIQRAVFLAALGLPTMLLPNASADEGMWLFTNPPRKLLQEKYGFDPSAPWLEHVQKSSIRFNSGGSGSFVSPNGLIITNHHVASDAIQKLSTPQKDYMKNGFYAKTQDEELKCVDEEINVLMSIEDVTDKIHGAVKSGMSPAEAEKARRAVMNTLEKESQEKSGLKSSIVTLYQGGQYHLYRYKKYTDVRLVFAPEKAIAFFGGDPDNFEYPRYDLDVTFLRAYENGKPAKIEHYLTWSPTGPQDNELVFISGHPGRTDRLNTLAHLKFLRDRDMPMRLNLIRRREVTLNAWSARSAENARRAEKDLFSMQNSRKVRLGMLATLQDPAFMAQKRESEKAFRDAVAKDPQLQQSLGNAWDQVVESLKAWEPIYYENYMLEIGAGFNSELFSKARELVRLAEETAKPNAERLREYGDAGLESLKEELFSEAPIYDDLEIIKLTDSLGHLVEIMGAENPLVQKVLAGKQPADRARELVTGSKLKDVAFRKQLADGGTKGIQACEDPMIRLAVLLDEPARKVRKQFEEKVQEPQRQAYSKIARALFATQGTNAYPDATFTLRLAFGVVKGYEEEGKLLPPWTTLGGTFTHADHHGHKEPFDLPPTWINKKSRMNLETPFNFVSTVDAIGGNSGSPTLNRKAEFVGILFDGNIHGLGRNYQYVAGRAREIHVHSAGILEALRRVYDANALADELLGQK
jgi:hypothetical protein